MHFPLFMPGPGGSEFALQLLLRMMFLGVPLAAAIWTYRDARKHERMALPWAAVTLLVGPLFAVPLLLYVVTGPPRERWREMLE